MRLLPFWALLLATIAGIGHAQDQCPHRGDLDAQYCDANRDLVADPPTDPKRFKNPDTPSSAVRP